MSRKAFQKLNGKIRVIHVPYIGGGIPIPAEKRLMMLLWWLGKGETLLSVSDKFNVALSAVHKSNTLLLDEIIGLQHNYITWPNHNEIETLTNKFYRRGNIPGVVGAIDVANINFKAPTEQQESYIDRKMQHSIKLQGICTSDKIFTNIVVGWPGSVHDSRVFQNCEIFRKVSNNIERNKYFPTLEHHLVGDSAYPLLDYMMTPYRDNRNLTVEQRRFNYLHSKTRIVIEHTFGILKSRWRILKYINVNTVEKAVKIIVACCVLHNFCLVSGDAWEEYNEVEDNNINVFHNVQNVVNNFAVDKRNRIAQML
ncbi:protein ALP1-like [Anoplophora glabripennis]|uniref:protein ALP1-like n=1 Tax=Anoplophora glabripennis TaxID=217634 RepID=UPI0008756AA0|nr:protein ALP1-like [Anoplophora glabripennis]